MRHLALSFAALALVGLATTTASAGPQHGVAAQIAAQAAAHHGHHRHHGYHRHHGRYWHHGHHRRHHPPIVLPAPVYPAYPYYGVGHSGGFYYGTPGFSLAIGF
jgi:hypothetical protein